MPALTSSRAMGGRARTLAVLAFPLGVWAVWRIAQAVVLVTAGGDLFDDTFRWDSNWYLSILARGYHVADPSYAAQSNVAFFPGLVWLTRPFTWVAGDRQAAFVVANLTSLSAFLAVFGAVRAVVDDRVARRAVLALALWPTSLFLVAYYSEALFVSATAAAVWAARRDTPVAAYVAAFVAGLTRSIGFVLGPILAVDRYLRVRRIDRVVIGYAVSSPVGLALVAATQHRQVGDPLAFANAQQAWGVELAPPWEGVRRTFRTVNANWPDNHHWGVTLDSVAIVAVVVAMVVVTVRCWHRRSGPALVGWGWAGAVSPLCTTIFISYSRYVLAAWPALVAVSVGESKAARVARVVVAVAAAAWSVVLVRMWADGQWVA